VGYKNRTTGLAAGGTWRRTEVDLPTQLAQRAARKIMAAGRPGYIPRMEDIAAIIDKETKLPQWKAALEGLTPSGSEFVDDPERCRKFVKDRLDNGHTMLMDSLRRCKALQVALEDVAEWLETGKVNGVGYDEASVLASVKEALAPPKVQP
jgi:hypothetical protein